MEELERGDGVGTTAQVLSFMKYNLHFVEEMSSVLLDLRRRTCHSLVFNYFMAGKSLQGMLKHFSLAARMLLCAIAQEKAAAAHEPGAHALRVAFPASCTRGWAAC